MSAEFHAKYEQGLAALAAQSVWPDGVIARHLTWAGAYLPDLELTVDVSIVDGMAHAGCRGCLIGNRSPEIQLRDVVAPWAAEHAAACRALPRPKEA